MFFVHFAWRDENVPIFLCVWHILKNYKKTTISKIKDVSLRNFVFNECRMWMYTQLGYNEDEQLFFDRIISSAKNAWERGGHVLQDFASYFSSQYFPIIGTLYPIYSHYLVYRFQTQHYVILCVKFLSFVSDIAWNINNK